MKSFVIFAVITILINIAKTEKKIVCYYGAWATYRQSNGKCSVENLDPLLCTHFIYTFFGITQDGDINSLDPWLDFETNGGLGSIKKFNNLKLKNPNLKTLAAVGGFNAGSQTFSLVAKNASKRKNFATKTREFLTKYNFDGLDIDWEYPAQRDGDASVDKTNFILLLQDIKEEFKKYNLLLTAAVAATKTSADISYDIPGMMKYVDFVNVMVYDMHSASDGILGYNAPLYASAADQTNGQQELNVKSSITYWLSKGAKPNKLVLGVPFYGHTFTLKNYKETTVGSPCTGPGTPGPYTQQAGTLGYNEFCEQRKTIKWTTKWDQVQQVPYAFNGNQWISYDNIKSIELKSKFAYDNNLGGVMIWSVETDDFRGICGNKWPLLTEINKILKIEDPDITTEIVTKPTTDSNPGNDFKCPSNGLFKDPKDCNKFYSCSNGYAYRMSCPKGLYFNPDTLVCDYPWNVDCEQ